MTPTLDDPPVVVRHSRFKLALLCLFAGAASWAGIRMLLEGRAENVPGMWFLLVFFGAIAIRALLLAIIPGRLIIDSTGLTVRKLWKQWDFAWSDFESFELQPVARWAKRASFNLSDSCPQNRRKTFVGLQGSFGGTWQAGPRELVDLLTAAKKKWGARHIVHRSAN